MTIINTLRTFSLVVSTALLLVAGQLHAEDLLKKTVDISGIDRLEMAGPGLLTLSQGDTESLEIIASDKVMARIEVDARGSTLRLKLKEGNSWGFFKIDNKIHYQLTLKTLNKISTAGSADIELATDLQAEKLELKRAGSGDMVFKNISATQLNMSSAGSGDFKADTISVEMLELNTAGSGDISVNKVNAKGKIEIDTAGSGDINIDQLDGIELEISMAGSGDTQIKQGTVSRQSVDVSGSGNYSAARLKSAIAELDLSGAADAKVWVTDELIVDASGASDVQYYGQPLVKADTSGASSVKSLGVNP